MSIIKTAAGVALGLLLFIFVAMVGCAALFTSASTDNTKGVCDKAGCSTQDAAVDAARKHVAARPGHYAVGACLWRGGDGWYAWSLTATDCPPGETFVRL